MKRNWETFVLLIGVIVIVILTLLIGGGKISPREDVLIKNMNEVEALAGTGNIERQIVIIYQDDIKADIGLLELVKAEVKYGRNLSEHVDVIELQDGVDMSDMIEKLNMNEYVKVADQNGTVSTTID